jgi:hypothetical protein
LITRCRKFSIGKAAGRNGSEPTSYCQKLYEKQ